MIDKQIMNVNMTGKEYIEYRKSRKLKKNQLHAVFYFALCIVGLVLVAFLWGELTKAPATESVFDAWYELVDSGTALTWNEIGKKTFLFFAPFLVIMIAGAWLFHGFGFIIIRR